MKASLKFREDQRPLARAKIPISILGLPFIAGGATGDPHDLRLDLTTGFESGPAFRVSYRPKEPSNPFTIAVKTGIGTFGSPVGAPMSMITEFNFLSRSGSPAFSVVFKPRIGDFCFRKSASSPSSSGKIIPVSDADEKFSPQLAPSVNGNHVSAKTNGFAVDFPAAQGGIGGLVSGVEVTARSVLPICSLASVGFRWGLRMQTELRSPFLADAFSMTNLPMLVMNKISIEHIPAAARVRLLEDGNLNVASGEAAQACASVRKELAVLHAESTALRKSVDDLHEKIIGASSVAGKMSPAMRNNDKFSATDKKGGQRAVVPEPKKEKPSEVQSTPEDINEELKKALMSATVAGK